MVVVDFGSRMLFRVNDIEYVFIFFLNPSGRLLQPPKKPSLQDRKRGEQELSIIQEHLKENTQLVDTLNNDMVDVREGERTYVVICERRY